MPSDVEAEQIAEILANFDCDGTLDSKDARHLVFFYRQLQDEVERLEGDSQARSRSNLHALAELCRANIPVSQLIVAEAMGVKFPCKQVMRDVFDVQMMIDDVSRLKTEEGG